MTIENSTNPKADWQAVALRGCLLMFEKEIILKEQLAAPCLFQCSVDGKLAANDGVGLLKVARDTGVS
jgi:hypothetical protein